MKLLKKLGLAALGSLSLASSVLPSIAAVPADIFKDSAGNVYVHGSTASTMAANANARISTNEPLTRTIRAGYCGEIRISTSSTLPSIGNSWTVGSGAAITRPTTVFSSRETLPACRSNAFTPAASGNFVDSTTAGVDRVILTGFTPGQSYQVSFNGVNASQSARPNACGFYRISNTAANPIPSQLTINGTTVTVANLPVAAPPLCQRNSSTGTYVRYVPDTWNN